MSTTIVCSHGFSVTGELAGFDEGSAQLIFKFRSGSSVEVPHPSPQMVASLTQVGLALLANSEINFVTNRVTIQEKKSSIQKAMDNSISTTSIGISR